MTVSYNLYQGDSNEELEKLQNSNNLNKSKCGCDYENWTAQSERGSFQ